MDLSYRMCARRLGLYMKNDSRSIRARSLGFRFFRATDFRDDAFETLASTLSHH